jgi:alpha-glutamyl/putrescinyl thymine pyrophosphorylase clade 1
MNYKPLLRFIFERHAIYGRKAEGLPKPWTHDKILQSYRFCNVYRELDTVTQWIATHWREPHKDDPDLWFAMCVARLVNWPDTLEALGFPIPWQPNRFIEVLERRKKDGEKVFTGAYMVPGGPDGISKARYLAAEVLTPMWRDKEKIRPVQDDRLSDFYERLSEYQVMGSFMTGQVVADVKYVRPLLCAKDWWTWASPGPGSQRGLNRVMGRDIKSPWARVDWYKCLRELHDKIQKRFTGMPKLHAQDLQNCLCEFDKYERVRLGEGRPRSLYDGAGDSQSSLRFPRS